MRQQKTVEVNGQSVTVYELTTKDVVQMSEADEAGETLLGLVTGDIEILCQITATDRFCKCHALLKRCGNRLCNGNTQYKGENHGDADNNHQNEPQHDRIEVH